MMASETTSDTMEVDSEKAALGESDCNKVSGGPFGDIAKDCDNQKHKETIGDSETRIKRQIKKDDSGISVEKSENSSEDDASKRPKTSNEQEIGCSSTCSAKDISSFVKLTAKAKNRNYRNKKTEQCIDSSDEDGNITDKDDTVKTVEGKSRPDSGHQENKEGRSSPDSGHQESSSALDDVEMEESRAPQEDAEMTEGMRKRTRVSESEDSHDSAESEDKKSESLDSEAEEEEEEVTPTVLLKPKPKHKWFVMQEVVNRQKGMSGRCQGSVLFQQRCYGSLHAVQRLELMYKLEAHHGCVNALHFNSSGTLLASGSDDLRVIVWDWALGKFLISYDSGHRSNVFQVKFLPLIGNSHIVSCGRDGQIRLAELTSSGLCRSTRRLAQHRGPAHKLSILPETPHVFLSSGEDGLVLSVDVRVSKPDKLVTVCEDGRNIALYSIHSNPLNNNEFCVSGRHNYIRIYDRRKISNHEELKRYCPRHLVSSSSVAHVTCAVFNYNGTEIVGSYNDEDIYLFDTRQPDGTEYVHKYEGHRNSATVKGLSFFGPRSEYIVSGSDCGNIYFWDKSTESIVQWMAGDENGVVNCLEPHPQIPAIATSGLDDDVKIWVPSCEQEPVMDGLKSAVVSNYKGREDDRQRDPDAFDGQMLWILWRHIRRTERRRNGHHPNRSHSPPFSRWSSSGQRNPQRDSSSSDTTNSSDAEDAEHRIQCSPS